MRRHAASHVSAKLRLVAEQELASEAGALLDSARMLEQRAIRLIEESEQAGDRRAAVAALREARGCIELQARMTGQLEVSASGRAGVQATQVNVQVDTQARDLDEELRRVLRERQEEAAMRERRQTPQLPPPLQPEDDNW
ncbi:MAG TPA: hypothetical protein VNE62_01285 [Actinomycetota bacterium]|nr:hypothetical protein [Actinomycetota bacterium]